MEANDSPNQLYDDIETWLSIDTGRHIVFASFTWIVYEYLITLEKEVKYFWSGKWTPSRALYLINRYLPPIIMSLLIVCFNAPVSLTKSCNYPFYRVIFVNLTSITLISCDRTIRAIFGLSTVALFVIQGILVVRVFYLFEHSKIARIIIALTYAVAIGSTITTLSLVMYHASLLTPLSALARRVHLVGCPVHPMTDFWHLYIAAFGLHTVLYIFTLIRVLNCEDSPQALLIKRLHRDGGFFYIVVIITVGYTEIGSGLFHIPAINIPAVFANLLLAATSISISRVMLSFHELADQLRNNPNRLGPINSIQLNRVNWRKGSRDGEYVVTGNEHASHVDVLDA